MLYRHQLMYKTLFILIFFSLALTACFGNSQPDMLTTATPTASSSPIPSTFTATAIPSPTVTMFPTSTPEPLGCQKPPDDYTRIEVNGWTINTRTLAMLSH